jgi:hypothetical protein
MIHKIIESIDKLHGDQRDQDAKHRSYNEWLRAKPIPTVRSPSGHQVPDYSQPGVAEQVRAEVDDIEAECFIKGRK